MLKRVTWPLAIILIFIIISFSYIYGRNKFWKIGTQKRCKWNNPEKVMPSLNGYSRWPSLSVSKKEEVFVTVSQSIDERFIPNEIFLSKRNRNGVWKEPINISESKSPSGRTVQIVSNEKVKIIWGEGDRKGSSSLPNSLYHREVTNNVKSKKVRLIKVKSIGNTNSVVNVEGDMAEYYNGVTDFVTTVLKKGGLRMLYLKNRLGEWSTVKEIEAKGASIDVKNEKGWLVYISPIRKGSLKGKNGIYVRKISSKGKWMQRDTISVVNRRGASNPKIKIGKSNVLHVIWSNNDKESRGANCVTHLYRNESDIWRKGGKLCINEEGGIFDAEILSNKNNNLNIFISWRLSIGSEKGHIYHSVFDRENGWSSPYQIPVIEQGGPFFDAEYGPRGVLHLAWTKFEEPGSEVYYTRSKECY